MADIRTFCRVCEPACGLVAAVEDGRLAAVRPDPAHPVSRGWACNNPLSNMAHMMGIPVEVRSAEPGLAPSLERP